MNPSKVTNPTCVETENKQIQVPPRLKKKLQYTALFTNQIIGIIGVDEGGARERRKARDARIAANGKLPETSHNCQPSESSKTANAEDIEGNSLKPNVKYDKQVGNVSTKLENDNNNLDSQTANAKDVKQADHFTRNDKRTNNSFVDCTKPSVKSNTPAHNNVRQIVERDNNNYQCHPKTITSQASHFPINDKRNSLADHAKSNVKNNAPAYNVRQNVDRDTKNDQFHHKIDDYQGISKDDSHTDDGWGAISENGDYPEDVWGSEREEDSHKQNKYNDRSKTSSSSKCFQTVQHVVPRDTEAFNSTQQNYTSTKRDLTDDRHNYNCGRLQNDTKDWNHRNNNKNDCPLSHVELKTTNRRDYLTESKSLEFEIKEAYRPKSDFQGSNAHSYQDKNSSKINQFNFNNRNPSCNAYAPPISKNKPNNKQDICVKNENQEPESEGSGWPDLDDKKSSCNDDCFWENSKENQKEVRSDEPKSYQRSISTPYSHTLSYSNPRRDGRGDEKDHKFQPENSKMQREFPKSKLSRSTSFTDRTNNRFANRTAGDHNTYQSCKAENGFRVDSNESTFSNTETNNWHETINSSKPANSPVSVGQKLKSLGSNKLTTPSSSNNNETKVKRSCFLKCANQSNADDDNNKWNFTTEISTVVLEEESIKTFDSKRVVIGNSMDDIKIIVSCRKEPDIIDTKNNQESLANFSEVNDSPQLPFLDPLEDDFVFFDDNPDPFIPAPQPPSAFVQLDNCAASNSQVEKLNLESQKNAVKLSTSEEMLKGMPDARHVQEITSYLTQLEIEKSVPLETSEKILKDITKALHHSSQSSWGEDLVYIYGSYVSGLAVSTSNINFAVKTYEEIKSKQANSYLLHMQRGLLNVLKGYQVEPFDEDTNPKKSKICFTETNSGIPCELGFYNSTVAKYLIMNKMLHDICEFDQRIKTLLIVTRIWAEVCLIHESEEGKLHPVGYSLLMLHFLQSLDKPLLPILNMDPSAKHWGLDQLEEKNKSSVGELWLAFLKFYSEFNWRDNVVTVNSNTSVSKTWEHSFIAIEDPFTQDNIGDSVVSDQNAECIFACFKASYQYFSTPVDYDDSDSSDSENSNSFKKEVFSFNYISFDQNIPTICEKCEELDETCNKCRPRKEVIVQPLPELSEASLECVNRTLYDVYNEFRLPQCQTEERIAFVKIFESDVKKMFPGAKLKLFGSSVNGFGFKKSDLDICMTFNHKLESNREIHGILHQIVRFLRRRPNLYENVYGLYHAKIPIVKFHVIQQDWHCDLSFCNILAVHNSKLLWKYSLYDERCCVLGCALKLLAKKACLDDTRHLSSYSYILTVIHYLQQVKPPVLPVFTIDHKEVFDENLMIPKEAMDRCNYWLNDKIENLKTKWYPLDPKNKNESTVGQLWLGLLDFYARYDNTYAITITQKEPLLSSNLRRCARLLNIQDPFLEKDNLGCILNDIGADETRKVLTRARLLFGKEIPKEHKAFPERYFFSSSYLTGRSIKEIECEGCGGFGHQKSECLKADPFKRFLWPDDT
ncbi:hypothetical protein JTE90_025864 [Oedothorax gibbosus]|uniref:Terminal uridylyltransferase 4 n=1 Tax=Oedothorax gibbosus TaxID=931172 RepID=A0AAV6UM21_9ARAC|nr:hypothetical protein JTE90_025864 [Oedothorax gibbosus]